MSFFETTYLYGPYGNMVIPSGVSGVAEGLGTISEKLSERKKSKSAKQFLGQSDAPDWIKALGEIDSKEAVETYGQYKTGLASSATSFEHTKQLKELDHKYSEAELTLKSQLERANETSKSAQEVIDRIIANEHAYKLREKELNLMSNLDQGQALAKLQSERSLIMQDRQHLAKSVELFAPSWGITSTTKKALIEYALSGSPGNLESIKGLLPKPSGGLFASGIGQFQSKYNFTPSSNTAPAINTRQPIGE